MKSVIIGTAGHIDHGKTALVKALTGIDADRLEEEKRRGITIDIGFAHLELAAPNGEKLRLGFVDVPGHERFVRNMLAGVGGIDVVLLVIAADESIMPQTREHFDICRLLSVRRGITVLTKADTVDAETLDVVKLEVEEFLRGWFLDPNQAGGASSREGALPSALGSQQSALGQPSAIRYQVSARADEATNQPSAPIIAVSSLTGAGLPELKQALARIASEVPAKDSSALARLPIDRVFTMKGFGTVVTGTLVAGTIRKEDELEVFPIGKRVRVRGVQVHGETAETAIAGQRTALNLAGVTVEELSRGMMLAPLETFRATTRVDVKLSLLPSARPLKDRARVHLHAHTSETIAGVTFDGEKAMKPGQTAFARLRLARPMQLLPGDRFIVRQFSPVVTIGGGVVLDAVSLSRRLHKDSTLEALAEGDRGAIVYARVARTYHDGISMSDLVAETGWTPRVLEPYLSEAVNEKRIVRAGDIFLVTSAWDVLRNQVLGSVTDFHQKNPLEPGIGKEVLQVLTDASPAIFETIVQGLASEKRLELFGDLVHLPGRGVVMKDEEAESKKIIEQAFASAGLQVPALYTVLAGLKVDKARAQKIVTLLLRDKVLIKISEELVFHQSALANLRTQLAAYKTKVTVAGVAKIDVGKFKEMTGVSRKYAIPLLEYLDRERVTRRVGDERVIL